MIASLATPSFGCVVLVAFAATLLVGCPSVAPEEGALFERQIEGNVFDSTPVRGAFGPLIYRRGSFTYRCSECHDDLRGAVKGELKGEHREIQAVFNHGMNTICLNCHHATDRGAYVAHDGSRIAAENPAQLCAKCHGPVFREWQIGIHGRQNGYWDRTKGRRTKLLCVQCHDPHRPAFAPMRPEPAPDYSRFVKEAPVQHSDGPLRAAGH